MKKINAAGLDWNVKIPELDAILKNEGFERTKRSDYARLRASGRELKVVRLVAKDKKQPSYRVLYHAMARRPAEAAI